MNPPLAFRNGEFVSPERLFVPVYDGGFMQGVTVAEQLRTFGGRLFCLDQHLARLHRSLEIVEVDSGFSVEQLGEFANRLAANNHALLTPGDDLGLSMFVTPGGYPTFAGGDVGPLVGMHTYPLPFGQWSAKYRGGQSLVVSDVRQVPDNCWPAELKCRSRMHYFLADRQAARRESGARALLLDQDGFVAEASTASVLIHRPDEGLVSPPREKILPGISVATLEQIAADLQIPFENRELTVADVLDAGEVLLCSTSPCILPVTRVDGRAIGRGVPGPVFQQLLEAWSQRTGVSIAAQAERFAARPPG